MFQPLKRNHNHKKNEVVQKTFPSILKEAIVVCIWISFCAITVWGTDSLGLLSSNAHRPAKPSLQVDFPAVYKIWQQKKVVFVDTRPATNFKGGHIPGAVNVPIHRALAELKVLPKDKDTPLITYCGSITCPNAYQLMNILSKQGYQNVRFFPRGLRGWLELGYPLDTE